MPPSSGYGAIHGSERQMNANGGGGSGGDDDEAQPLLGSPPKVSYWRRRIMADVRREHADLILILCYVITGLLDSASISAWGSFVSMQTGNTVYIGLGLAAPHESTRWIKSITSLGCFCVGSMFFSSFHRRFSPKRRWVLCASFLLQMVLVIAAAAIVTFASPAGPPPTDSGDREDAKEYVGWTVLVPIALVAFQSCGQAVTSRALKYNALTSVVLTSIYCDLFSDANLFALRNVERNQRVGAPLCLLFGAIAGGLLAKHGGHEIGIAIALWVAAALKLVVVLAWFSWPSEEDE